MKPSNELKEEAEKLIDQFQDDLLKSSLPGPFKASLTRPERALLLTFILWRTVQPPKET
jgi:hypothetical protein